VKVKRIQTHTLFLSLACASILGFWCGGAVGEVEQERKMPNENLIKAQMQAKALQTTESKQTNIPPRVGNVTATITHEGQTWNLKDVDIRTLINEVSKITGKDFVVAPEVDAKVTFIAKQTLAPDELYQAFLAVLRTYGFVAIPEGKVIKVVSDRTPNRLSGPLAFKPMKGYKSEMVVTAIRVVNYPAAELVKVLQPLMPRYSFIDVYRPSNSLIIADHADNIDKIQELVSRLDVPAEDKLEVIRLKNSSAADLVTSLNKLFVTASSPANSRMGLQLSADDHTNSILMYGGTREQRLEVRAAAAKLDINYVSNRDNMEVFYLRYIPAETVAPVLQGIVDNYFASMTQAEKLTTQGAAQPTGPGGTIGGATTQPSVLPRATNLLNPSSPPVTSSQGGYGIGGTSTTGGFGQEVQTGKTFTPPRSGSLSPYIQWEESTNSVIVTGPAALIQKLRRVVAKLDIRLPQVLIEVVIAEVTLGQEKDLGVEWSFKGNYQAHTRFGNDAITQNLSPATPTFPTATALGTLGTGLTLGFLSNNDLRAVVRALHTDSRSNILATPNLVTLDNQEAVIKVGQKVSFATSQINNNPTGGNPLTTFDREDVGLILVIKPQITPDGSVKLLIQQEISSLLPPSISTVTNGNPNTSERFISTMVMAKNNQTLVLGGLLQNQWNNNVEKVPFFGDLPVLGWLFRAKQDTNSKTNLMIFMRPIIISDDRSIEKITGGKYEFLRQEQIHTDHPNSDLIATPAVPLRNEVHLLKPDYEPPLKPCLPPIYKPEPPELLDAEVHYSEFGPPSGRLRRNLVLPSQRFSNANPNRQALPRPEMLDAIKE
jgi:general secretion pathway protein D